MELRKQRFSDNINIWVEQALLSMCLAISTRIFLFYSNFNRNFVASETI